jgi:hypothetical protein
MPHFGVFIFWTIIKYCILFLSDFSWTSVFCFFYIIVYMDSWGPSYVQKMVNTSHIKAVFSTPYENKNLYIFICTVFFSSERKKWNLETFVYGFLGGYHAFSVFWYCVWFREKFFAFRGEYRIFSTCFQYRELFRRWWILYSQYCIFSIVFLVP